MAAPFFIIRQRAGSVSVLFEHLDEKVRVLKQNAGLDHIRVRILKCLS